MNNKIVNTFFFKYFNDGIINITLLEFIPMELYMYVNLQLNNYNLNKDKTKINFDQYQYNLYQILITDYSSQLDKFLKEKNKK
jgi:hypothetical protein